jgi:hypothetical protein
MFWVVQNCRNMDSKIGTDREDFVTRVVERLSLEGHKFPISVTSHRIAMFKCHSDDTTRLRVSHRDET